MFACSAFRSRAAGADVVSVRLCLEQSEDSLQLPLGEDPVVRARLIDAFFRESPILKGLMVVSKEISNSRLLAIAEKADGSFHACIEWRVAEQRLLS
jgi:hypothetical protein